MNDIEKRFAAIKEVDADSDEIKAINRIKKENDTSEGITLEQMDILRAKQENKMSLRFVKRPINKVIRRGDSQ